MTKISRERAVLNEFIQGIITITDKVIGGVNALDSLRWYGGECPNIVFIRDGYGNEPPWEVTIALSIRPVETESKSSGPGTFVSGIGFVPDPEPEVKP